MENENNKSLVLNINDVLNDSQSSVKLSQTSRGTNWEIKVYNSNPEKALEIANTLFEQCREKYQRVEDGLHT